MLHYSPWILARRTNPDTLARYDHAWGQIAGKVGHLRFDEMTLSGLQEVFAGIEHGPTTQNLAKTVLAQIVRLAIALGQATESHLTLVRLVAVEKAPKRKARQDVAEKAAKLLAAAQATGHWAEAFVWTAMTLGLRKGELLGIKRTDVDERAMTLTVQRQRNHTQGERETLKSKRAGDERVIGLPEPILKRLVGYFRPGAIYLIVDRRGKPASYQHMDRAIDHLGEIAGVKLTPHDFRSAAICNLIDAGVGDHAIEELVGHGSAAMIRVYRDSRAARTRDALSRLATADNQVG